jgi:hypothetical protein
LFVRACEDGVLAEIDSGFLDLQALLGGEDHKGRLGFGVFEFLFPVQH